MLASQKFAPNGIDNSCADWAEVITGSPLVHAVTVLTGCTLAMMFT